MGNNGFGLAGLADEILAGHTPEVYNHREASDTRTAREKAGQEHRARLNRQAGAPEKQAQAKKDRNRELDLAYAAELARAPHISYAIRATEFLLDLYEIDHYDTVMANFQAAGETMFFNKSGKVQIRFGWNSLDRIFEGKSSPRLQKEWNLVNWARLKGLARVHQVVLHELSHAVEFTSGDWDKGHGETWKAAYKEVMELAPEVIAL